MRCNAGIFLFFFTAVFFTAVKAGAQQNATDFPSNLFPFEMPSARAAGGGGYHSAFGDDINVLFANPALLSSCEGQISIAELSVASVDLGMFGLYLDYFLKTGDKSYQSYIEESRKNAVDLGGPLGIGLVYKGFGVAAFNISRSAITFTEETARKASVEFNEDFFITMGYGLNLFDTGGARGDIGLAAKFFYRFLNAKAIASSEMRVFLEKLNNYPLETQMGGGVDAGLRFTAGKVSLGITIHDPYSPAIVKHYEDRAAFVKGSDTGSSTINVLPRLSAGFAWQPEPLFWNHIISNFTFTLDFHNVLAALDTKRNPLLELSAGFEVTLEENVSFRAGMSDLFPTAGLGFNFGLFKLDAAIHMVECGDAIWQYPALAFNLSILYRYRFPPVRN